MLIVGTEWACRSFPAPTAHQQARIDCLDRTVRVAVVCGVCEPVFPLQSAIGSRPKEANGKE